MVVASLKPLMVVASPQPLQGFGLLAMLYGYIYIYAPWKSKEAEIGLTFYSEI